MKRIKVKIYINNERRRLSNGDGWHVLLPVLRLLCIDTEPFQ